MRDLVKSVLAKVLRLRPKTGSSHKHESDHSMNWCGNALQIPTLIIALALPALGLGLWIVWINIVPMLGFVLFLFIGFSGIGQTRIGRELAYVIVHSIGVSGLNTSGRPGDDPFAGLENFPWLLLSLATLASIVIVSVRWKMIRRSQKRLGKAGSEEPIR